MGVKVNFLGEQPSQNGGTQEVAGVLVPRESVREDAGQPVVYVFRNGRVERRAIRLGSASGSDQEIIAGVSGGDQVVVTSSQELRDGQTAKVEQ
jgi:hypothetical protein